MRFSHFFIDRPIFAAAVSVVITLTGLISYLTLPVDQSRRSPLRPCRSTRCIPAPRPRRSRTRWPRRSSSRSTASTNMLYMSSSSTSEGRMTITVTFKNDTNVDIAQVDVQNRIQSVLPQLPQDRARPRDHGAQREHGHPADRAHVRGRLERGPQVHRQLRESPGSRAPAADAGRRRRGRERGARLRDARLDRSGPRGRARPHGRRDRRRAAQQQPSGRGRRDRLAAVQRQSRRAYQLNIRAQGRLDTPEEFADAIIKRDAQGRSHADRRRRARRARRAELRRQRLHEPGARGVALGSAGAEHERARDLGQHPQHDGGAQGAVPARA